MKYFHLFCVTVILVIFNNVYFLSALDKNIDPKAASLRIHGQGSKHSQSEQTFGDVLSVHSIRKGKRSKSTRTIASASPVKQFANIVVYNSSTTTCATANINFGTSVVLNTCFVIGNNNADDDDDYLYDDDYFGTVVKSEMFKVSKSHLSLVYYSDPACTQILNNETFPLNTCTSYYDEYYADISVADYITWPFSGPAELYVFFCYQLNIMLLGYQNHYINL